MLCWCIFDRLPKKDVSVCLKTVVPITEDVTPIYNRRKLTNGSSSVSLLRSHNKENLSTESILMMTFGTAVIYGSERKLTNGRTSVSMLRSHNKEYLSTHLPNQFLCHLIQALLSSLSISVIK